MNDIENAAERMLRAKSVTAFTGAGISVESGIPPFRGKNGLWNRYDPVFLDISYFRSYPGKSWKLIKEIFYDFFGAAKPNAAHYGLVEMEKNGFLFNTITQNIDNLHQKAGSKEVYEFHGNSRFLVCDKCGKRQLAEETSFSSLPPLCGGCGGVLRPDFVFFGEPIPEPAKSKSFMSAKKSDVFLLIGTTGEIMPASQIPYLAKQNGCIIIEINTEPSNYTHDITDVFLKGKATEKTGELLKTIKRKNK